MNLPQLYYFRKLAEVQHYTEAAKLLYISQPTLSDSIASLEKELSCSLFKKKGRGIVLTKYGIEFYEYVNQSLTILERGIAMIKQKSGHISGDINIGCIPTLIGDFLPDAVEKYKKKNALANIHIFYGMSLDIVEKISSGKYDIGLCSKVENMPDLVFVPITYQEIIALVQDNHTLAKYDEICLEELRKYPLISYSDEIPIGKVVCKLLKQHNIEASCCYDNEISIGGEIKKSSKVAICADTSFLRQFDNLHKIHITDIPKDTRMLYMVYSNKNFINSAVQAFANFLIADCLNLP